MTAPARRRATRPELASLIEQACASLHLVAEALDAYRRELAATPPEPEIGNGRRVHTLESAAEVLRISRRSVMRLVEDGDLFAVRAGRRVLITDEAIDQYLSTGGAG